MGKQQINVVWLKRDLRLQDHAPLFRAEQEEIQLFFENDPHLTENGQRLLAKVVLEELCLDESRTE